VPVISLVDRSRLYSSPSSPAVAPLRTGPCGISTQMRQAPSGFAVNRTNDVGCKPVVDAAKLPYEELVEVHVATPRVFDELLENLQVHIRRVVLDLKHLP